MTESGFFWRVAEKHSGGSLERSDSKSTSPYDWWRFRFFNSIGSHSVECVNQYLCIEVSVDRLQLCPNASESHAPLSSHKLSLLQLCRHFRLGDVVDARATAAPRRFGQLDQLKPGMALRTSLGCFVIFCPWHR